ncbi:hypothetical protein M0804_013278 [Polistes exclamans]|nr:hypothetical protein M0804_013278 [Polistes exclamans]
MDIIEEGARFKKWLLLKFESESMVFLKWLNSFEYIIEVSHTGDNEKVKCLLNMMAPSTLKKIENILHPSDPIDLPYDELITVLVNTFSKFKGTEVPNFRYLFRPQYPYESIEHYVLALRQFYSRCTPYFKNSVNVKYRFMEGLRDRKTKDFFREDKSMSFSVAVAIAKQMEYAKNKKSEE